jgi:hypothetical protein
MNEQKSRQNFTPRKILPALILNLVMTLPLFSFIYIRRLKGQIQLD